MDEFFKDMHLKYIGIYIYSPLSRRILLKANRGLKEFEKS